ncbi:MAG TPA: hypothetical protein O0X99_00935, partial [Methanocorpusculum sp.]|nr:hypothetical protein [Methanocorpusculum sp.]
LCFDKSLLLAYMLDKLGYDVVLLIFESSNHIAIGVKTNDTVSDFRGTGYAFIETTVPSIITDSYGLYGNDEKPLGKLSEIIHISYGGKCMDVSKEAKSILISKQSQDESNDFDNGLFNINKYNELRAIYWDKLILKLGSIFTWINRP